MIDCTVCNHKLLALNVVLFAFEVLLGHDLILVDFALFELVAQGS
jgi:hypothetical protein